MVWNLNHTGGGNSHSNGHYWDLGYGVHRSVAMGVFKYPMHCKSIPWYYKKGENKNYWTIISRTANVLSIIFLRRPYNSYLLMRWWMRRGFLTYSFMHILFLINMIILIIYSPFTKQWRLYYINAFQKHPMILIMHNNYTWTCTNHGKRVITANE